MPKARHVSPAMKGMTSIADWTVLVSRRDRHRSKHIRFCA